MTKPKKMSIGDVLIKPFTTRIKTKLEAKQDAVISAYKNPITYLKPH